MTLREMWKKYLELENEGSRLHDEACKLRGKGIRKVHIESWKLWREAGKILRNFIYENYGEEVTTNEEAERVVLSNGVILYDDGRVYEPLELVMKEIIKKYEESEK
jgi:hypothetical protein